MIRRGLALRSLAAASIATSAITVGMAVAAMAPEPARAQAQPFPLPTDSRLVVFNYGKDETYTILAIPMAVTHIEFGPGEEIAVTPAIGDSVQWQVTGGGRHLFIKPSKSDIFTSMTVITNLRTYQFTLRSSPAGGQWYQRVSWRYPDAIAAAQTLELSRQVERKRVDSLNASEPLDVEKLNFAYTVRGDAEFKPTTVFDNGVHTWIRMPRKNQELPAVFVRSEGQAQLVNYSVRGDFVVVQRLAEEFLLRLGEEEVRIRSDKHRHRVNGQSDASVGG